MTKGIVYTSIYYASGLSAAGLSYLIIGHPYIHAPGVHHIILFLTFIGGAAWLILAAIRYLIVKRSSFLAGVIAGNAVVIAAFVVVVWYEISRSERAIAGTDRDDQISMSIAGDTTMYYHNDNIIYMKVGDTVLLNFIDSVRFKQLVDSSGIESRPMSY